MGEPPAGDSNPADFCSSADDRATVIRAPVSNNLVPAGVNCVSVSSNAVSVSSNAVPVSRNDVSLSRNRVPECVNPISVSRNGVPPSLRDAASEGLMHSGWSRAPN